MPPPELWIVAGPNGAGKTTCVQKEPISALLPGVTFLNPDDRTRAKLRAAGYGGFADVPPGFSQVTSSTRRTTLPENLIGRLNLARR